MRTTGARGVQELPVRPRVLREPQVARRVRAEQPASPAAHRAGPQGAPELPDRAGAGAAGRRGAGQARAAQRQSARTAARQPQLVARLRGRGPQAEPAALRARQAAKARRTGNAGRRGRGRVRRLQPGTPRVVRRHLGRHQPQIELAAVPPAALMMALNCAGLFSPHCLFMPFFSYLSPPCRFGTKTELGRQTHGPCGLCSSRVPPVCYTNSVTLTKYTDRRACISSLRRWVRMYLVTSVHAF